MLSPRDGKLLTTIPDASAADVAAAIDSAASCFADKQWSGPAAAERRATVLRRVASLLREPERRAHLVRLESADCGKPLREAEADIDFCAVLCDYYADLVDDGSGGGGALAVEALASDPSEGFTARLQPEPVGVVGMSVLPLHSLFARRVCSRSARCRVRRITPWNFPLMQAMVKVAPAVAAGCTAVLKPSPLASLTCLTLGQLLAHGGAPAGALNVISGEGAGASGQWLAES
eukprot:SAG31_NODE_4307_length_3369_cov_2.579205_1_plen_232_part_10